MAKNKTIREIRELITEKKISCMELAVEKIKRIKKEDPKINSFITITENEAYAKAKTLDDHLAKNSDEALGMYPLLGIPIGYKDIFLTKGIRTTAGAKLLNDYVPQYSATVVERLEKAGVMMMGKLNCDAWAHGSSGENSDFGATCNPHNRDFVAGGSSSGSAASVASDFCTIATATDTCGSTRLPANYCGVVGLKPTYGVISRYGVIAMASSLDTVGVMANSVEDSQTVFEILMGEDKHDATLLRQGFEGRGTKTIGLPKEFFEKGLDPEIAKNIDRAVAVFTKLGYKIIDVSLPHTKYGISVYYIIQPAEVSSNLARFDGVRFGADRSAFSAEAKRRIILGTYVLSLDYHDAYYKKAMEVKAIIVDEVETVFAKTADFLLAPVSPGLPFKIGEKVSDPLSLYLMDVYAATANLSGIPSLALPFGTSIKGLPMGFQLMGPKFSEQELFTIGRQFENFVLSCTPCHSREGGNLYKQKTKTWIPHQVRDDSRKGGNDKGKI